MKINITFIAFVALVACACSSTRIEKKKNEKAINRVLGYNLVNDVIDRSNWLETHPMDTTIVTSVEYADTAVIAEQVRAARIAERKAIYERLKGKCMTQDIQHVIDSLYNVMHTIDTIKITKRITNTVVDNRLTRALKDSLAGVRVLCANATAQLYKEQLNYNELKAKSNSNNKKSKIIIALLLLALLLFAGGRLYNKVKKII